MIILSAIIYLVASFLVAYFVGRHRKVGFWGALVISILITPLLGIVISFASGLKKPVGCEWCGSYDYEEEYCGLCGRNRNGEIKPGFKK